MLYRQLVIDSMGGSPNMKFKSSGFAGRPILEHQTWDFETMKL